MTALKRRRGGGPELLAYRNGRRWCDVGSPEINEYIKGATRGDSPPRRFAAESPAIEVIGDG